MKVDTLRKLVLLLPRSTSEAITSEEIVRKYFKKSPGSTAGRSTHNTFIRRNIDQMVKRGMLDFVPKVLPPKKRIKRSERYFLQEHSLLKYFMNSKIALNAIWAGNVIKTMGHAYGFTDVEKAARGFRLDDRELTLTKKIRLVPDGIERKNAQIDGKVLQNCIAAIESSHTVMLRYHDRQGNPIDEINGQVERTILGLVAKDGTIYVISRVAPGEPPKHIAMHRIDEVRGTSKESVAGEESFDLDGYINDQHQLAHIKPDQKSPIKMVLKVAPEAMFHFNERAISSIFGDQVVEVPKGREKRYTVSITVPFTVQLPPFLWSHAGWIEVVSPPALRRFVGERILAAATYYQKDYEPRFGPE